MGANSPLLFCAEGGRPPVGRRISLQSDGGAQVPALRFSFGWCKTSPSPAASVSVRRSGRKLAAHDLEKALGDGGEGLVFVPDEIE